MRGGAFAPGRCGRTPRPAREGARASSRSSTAFSSEPTITWTSPADEPDPAGDRSRGTGGVARDHDDADPRRPAAPHGLGHLRARRVDHAHQPEELEPPARPRPASSPTSTGSARRAECEHAQRVMLHRSRCAPRASARSSSDEGGPRQARPRRRLLRMPSRSSPREVNRRHPLPLRAERDLGEARQTSPPPARGAGRPSRPATTSAASVGSPTIVQPPSACASRASLQSRPARRSSASVAGSTTRPSIWKRPNGS